MIPPVVYIIYRFSQNPAADLLAPTDRYLPLGPRQLLTIALLSRNLPLPKITAKVNVVVSSDTNRQTVCAAQKFSPAYKINPFEKPQTVLRY
jgi:hypothetical protein